MQYYCMDNSEEMSKLEKVKAQVSEVKGVMKENIDKVKLHNHLIVYSVC